MKLITNEYTVLINLDGGEDITIKPNTQFDPIIGNYKSTSSAYVRDAETREILVYLEAGKPFENLGEAPAPKKRAKVKEEAPTLLEE